MGAFFHSSEVSDRNAHAFDRRRQLASVNRENESLLTLERVRDAFRYDRDTGLFVWRNGNGNNRRRGDRAGVYQRNREGGRHYQLIRIDGRSYLGHRLAWFYVHGKWPNGEIDHINGVKFDNAIANLRDVTRKQNSWNISVPRRDNASNNRHIEKKGRKFLVAFSMRNKRIFHKSYPTLEAAVLARNTVASVLRGEYCAPAYRSEAASCP